MAERDEAIRAGHGGDGAETKVPRIASGIHSEDSVIDVESGLSTESPLSTSDEPEPAQEVPAGETGNQSELPPTAVITPDGVQELPPWLIGSDGKPLPINERTLRLIRGKTFTVRHDVAVCGHKVDRINQPKRNCHVCWWAFFQTHEMLVKTAHEFYQQFGKERLVALRGAKFVKYFHMFMSTVQHILEQQKLEQEKNADKGQDGTDLREIESSTSGVKRAE